MAVTTTTLSILDGSGASKSFATQTDPASVQRSVVCLDEAGAAFYRASINYTLGVATPTAVLVLQGSATKTIRIRRLALSGWSTTSGVMKVTATRRSTAGTLGSAVLTAVPNQGKDDSGTVAAATLTISTVGTANYTTLGTNAGFLDSAVVGFNKAAEVSVAPQIVWPTGGGSQSQAWVLRGTSDWITIDANGDAVPAGGILLATCEWIEDGS